MNVTAQLLAQFSSINATTVAMTTSMGVAVIIIATTLLAARRQRLAVARLEERVTHLNAGLSLLTNTTEDGLRGIALELTRLAGAAETRPRTVVSARQRIAAAAVHGKSVQDIASTEQVSEGEVLLHLLLDKLRTEGAHAEVC